MAENYKVTKGEIIMLSRGDYEDYGIGGLLVALKDFDLESIVKSVNKGPLYVDQYDLPSWLIENGYAVPVAHREIWVGKYNDGLFLKG